MRSDGLDEAFNHIVDDAGLANASATRESRWRNVLAGVQEQAVVRPTSLPNNTNCTTLFDVAPPPPTNRDAGSGERPERPQVPDTPMSNDIAFAAPGDAELGEQHASALSSRSRRNAFPCTFYAVDSFCEREGTHRKHKYRVLGWFTITSVEKALTCLDDTEAAHRYHIGRSSSGGGSSSASSTLSTPDVLRWFLDGREGTEWSDRYGSEDCRRSPRDAKILSAEILWPRGDCRHGSHLQPPRSRQSERVPVE